MAKKITKKKKKEAKTIKVRMLRPREFDLGNPSPDEKARQIMALNALQASEGWMLITQTIRAAITVLDEEIIGKFDRASRQPLGEKQCDRKRDQRNMMQELVDKPATLISNLTRTEASEPDDDPYEK